MAAEGAHVFLTGRTQSSVDTAIASIRPSATGIRSDITDLADLDALFGAIAAYGHGLGVLFAKRRWRRIRRTAQCHASTLPRHLHPQRRGNTIHRPKVAAPARPRRLDRAVRIHLRLQRNPLIRRVRRIQTPPSDPSAAPGQPNSSARTSGSTPWYPGRYRPRGWPVLQPPVKSRHCSMTSHPPSRWADSGVPTKSPPPCCSSPPTKAAS
jgi:hypothetical protein